MKPHVKTQISLAAQQTFRSSAWWVFGVLLLLLVLWPNVRRVNKPVAQADVPELVQYVTIKRSIDEQLYSLHKKKPTVDTSRRIAELSAETAALRPLVDAIQLGNNNRSEVAAVELNTNRKLLKMMRSGLTISGLDAEALRVRITELKLVVHRNLILQYSTDAKLTAISQLTRTFRDFLPTIWLLVFMVIWVSFFVLPENRSKQRELLNLTPTVTGDFYKYRNAIFVAYTFGTLSVVLILAFLIPLILSGWGDNNYPIVSMASGNQLVVLDSYQYVFNVIMLYYAAFVLLIAMNSVVQLFMKNAVIAVAAEIAVTGFGLAVNSGKWSPFSYLNVGKAALSNGTAMLSPVYGTLLMIITSIFLLVTVTVIANRRMSI